MRCDISLKSISYFIGTRYYAMLKTKEAERQTDGNAGLSMGPETWKK